MAQIADILGLAAGEAEPMVAVVRCNGTCMNRPRINQPDGALLRPHIVFFGEAVPMFERAAEIAGTADLMVVVGTSLAVYPAASLVRYVRPDVPIFLVDPGNPDTAMIRNPLTHIRSRAAEGMPELAERLKSEFS